MKLRLESPPTTIKNGTAWPKKLPSVAHVGTEDNLLTVVRMEEEADHLVVCEGRFRVEHNTKGLLMNAVSVHSTPPYCLQLHLES